MIKDISLMIWDVWVLDEVNLWPLAVQFSPNEHILLQFHNMLILLHPVTVLLCMGSITAMTVLNVHAHVNRIEQTEMQKSVIWNKFECCSVLLLL